VSLTIATGLHVSLTSNIKNSNSESKENYHHNSCENSILHGFKTDSYQETAEARSLPSSDHTNEGHEETEDPDDKSRHVD
jgi:hypothetical protein